MNKFNEYIEEIIIKALTKDKNIKDWREKNTFKPYRKIYIPSR